MPMGAWHDGPKPESDGRLGLGHDRTDCSERLYATVGVSAGVRRATPRLHVAIGMAMARRILNATKFQDFSMEPGSQNRPCCLDLSAVEPDRYRSVHLLQ